VFLLLAGAATSWAGVAATRPPARTQITILPYAQGVFGYVSSPTDPGCGDGRAVGVYASDGAGFHQIGVAHAKASGTSFMWYFRERGWKHLVARAEANAFCAAGRSPDESVQLTANGGLRASFPLCPAGPVCRFERLHFDTNVYCPSFTKSYGLCVGKSSGNVPWSVYITDLTGLSTAHFQWGGERRRYVAYGGIYVGIPFAGMDGFSPGPESASFEVNMAYTLFSPHPLARWATPNIPGARAGDAGGPLYLNFVNGVIGADVYIHGYLYQIAG
jgi:hypothetical protein